MCGQQGRNKKGAGQPNQPSAKESEVLEVRESKSRPTQGIVTVHTRAFNQDGKPVMDFIRTALIAKRGHGTAED